MNKNLANDSPPQKITASFNAHCYKVYWDILKSTCILLHYRLTNAVKILYSVSIYISYALSNFVSFDILWTNWIEVKYEYTDLNQKILWEYVVRTGIALLTSKYNLCWSRLTIVWGVMVLTFFILVVMAVAIPDFKLFISFTGSFCLSTMGIATPAIVQILVL